MLHGPIRSVRPRASPAAGPQHAIGIKDRETRFTLDDGLQDHTGLDLSMTETAVLIRQEGQRVWRETCVTDPGAMSALIRKRALAAKRVFKKGRSQYGFFTR